MKVLTIKQPYIELILMGVKRLETRAWPTKHRGPLLLHSSSKRDEAAITMAHELGILPKNHQFPTGKLLGMCNVVNCFDFKQGLTWLNLQPGGVAHEIMFGYFTPQMFAFELHSVVRFKSSQPLKGQVGLWDLEIEPAQLL